MALDQDVSLNPEKFVKRDNFEETKMKEEEPGFFDKMALVFDRD